MTRITASVGQGARNLPADVKTVQQLLNQNLYQLVPYAPLPENGIANDTLAAMIAEFQRRVGKLSAPDGRVDPGGATLHKLIAGVIKPRPAHVDAFIQKLLPSAKKVKANWRVPVSIVIAQGALESGWGQKVVGNAYFGIKGKSPSGSSTTFATTEFVNGKKIGITDTFRAYKDIDEAADDYGRMLAQNPRFAACFAYASDPLKFADQLQANGYATDPTYASKLKSIITGYRLLEFDR
jgi:hypothetical protein